MVLEHAQYVGFLPSTDLDRSREFFERLGLPCTTSSPHHCVFDANGAPLSVTAVTALRAAGVEPLLYEGPDGNNLSVTRLG
ncbi:MAG TPA: hypothetical protein VHW74_08025 [Mycobacteriales bacterium]|jgi:hypothetical protein|nr:hypothetical protein [Mycobacteriales bacterium]